MRTSIATVCLSGSLVEKFHACAEAGFDGVEVFEPDLLAAPQSPEEIRELASRLGLTLDLYQPFRDAEGVDKQEFSRVLRRANAKFSLMERLGIDTMLVCSNVATATVDDDHHSAAQLRELGDLAAERGIRLAYEALAWGRHVDDYRRAWRIVQLADHPAVGLCLDSFHILSRGHDPKEIENIPGERIFFLQLADAPAMSLDVLSWSRHYRLFPGEGAFDLSSFMGHVLRSGYSGPLSLEVFNDVFRQTEPTRTARQALRSLRWVADRTRIALGEEAPDGLTELPEAPSLDGFDFVEIKAADTAEVEVLLEQLGFTFRGRHRSKPVRLWTHGGARIVCNEQHAQGWTPTVAAIGFGVPQPVLAAERAEQLLAPAVPRRTYAGEEMLRAVAAPDGTEVFFGRSGSWVEEFEAGDTETTTDQAVSIDHVNLVQPWQFFDEAVLFYRSVLSLEPQAAADVAGPRGLVRSQVVRSPDGAVRLPLNLLPHGQSDPSTCSGPHTFGAQHVALRCNDAVAFAEEARKRGLRPLRVPDNYYDDLLARFDLPREIVVRFQALGLLFDRDVDGVYLHFYTRTVGGIFFEIVERRGAYDGYGAADAPVRLAAQRANE